MLPTLSPGDILLLKKKSSLNPGDIAVLKIEKDFFVVKRVKKIFGTALQVTSDNRFLESSLTLANLRVEAVVGKVLASCSFGQSTKIRWYR